MAGSSGLALLPLSTAVAFGVGFLWLAYQGVVLGMPAAPAGPARTARDLGACIVVTAAWACFYYVLLFRQSAAAFSEHARKRAKAKAQDPSAKGPSFAEVKYRLSPAGHSWLVLAANRAVANYLEQSLPFLVALYTYAGVVSASGAAIHGWVWLAARCLYPVVFPLPFPGVFLSTMPAYAVVLRMFAASVLAIV